MDDAKKSKAQLIEELHQLRQQLNEQKLKIAIAENMSEGVVVTSVSDDIMVYVNPRFEQMFGYDAGELLGQHVSILNAPTDRSPEEIVDDIRIALTTEGFWRGDIKNVRKDGSIFWCTASISAFDHSEYGPVWLSIHADITEKHLVESELKESNDLLNAVYQSSNISTFIVDVSPEKTYTYVDYNGAYEALLGIDPKDFRGKTPEYLIKYFEQDTVDAIISLYDSCVETKQTIETELFDRNEWWLCQFIPLVNDNGRVFRLIITAIPITERKKTEKALQQSKEKYQNLIDNIPVIIYEFSQGAGGIYYSGQVENVLGHSPEYLYKNPLLWNESIHPDDKPMVDDAIQTFIDDGTIDIEYRIQNADGEWLWLHDFSFARREENGNSVIVGIAIDVTKQKQVEIELRRSKNEVHQYVNTVASIFVGLNAQGEVILINPAGCKLLGYEQEELLGKNWFDTCVPGHLRDTVKGAFFQLISGELEPIEYYENPIVTKSGKEHMIAWHNNLLKDDITGEITGTVSSGEDVTQQRHYEQQLREQKELLERTFDSMDRAIFILDASLPPTVLDCNAAATSIFGYDKSEIVGTTVNFLHVSDDTLKEFQLSLYPAVERGEFPFRLPEFRMKRKSGEIFPSSHTVSPLVNDNGERIGWVSVVGDITQRKQAEDALRKSEESYRLLIETMNDGVAQVNAKGVCVYANEQLGKMLGYTKDEIIGQHWTKIIEGKANEIVKTQLEKRKQGDNSPYEIETVTGDGTSIFLRISPTPIFDAEGNPSGSMAVFTDITAHKNAEAALRESEEKYRLLVENMGESIVVLDTDGRFQFVNRIAAETMQTTVDDLIGKSLWEVFPKAIADERVKGIRKVSESGMAQVSETLIQTPTGEKRYYLSNTHPLYGEDGRVIRVMIINTDITELKNAQQALKESEARYKAIFEQAPIGIGISIDGRVLACNDTMSKMTGYTIDELLGGDARQTYYDVTDREAMFKLLEETGEVRDHEVHFVRKDGTSYWANVTIIPFPTVDENAILTLHQDITEKKQAEEHLRFQSQLLDVVGQSVMAINMENAITYWNPYSEQLYGWTAQEALGRSIMDIVPNDDTREQAEEILTSLKLGKSWSGEFSVQRKDGTVFPAMVTGTPIIDEHGNQIGTVGISSDITARKQAEQQTLELAIERERIQILAKFITQASHEFRTPLSVINMSTHLMKYAGFSPSQQRYVDKVEDSVNEIVALVDDLSIMAKIDSLHHLETETIDICEILQIVHTAKGEMHTIVCETQPLMLEANALYLQKAIEAVYDNAIRFTPADGTVSIKAYSRDDYFVVEIVDTGIGISELDLPRIFDRFYRTDKVGTTRGFGLGLPIAKSIIEAHQGHIEVESIVGEGSTFRILLPTAH